MKRLIRREPKPYVPKPLGLRWPSIFKALRPSRAFTLRKRGPRLGPSVGETELERRAVPLGQVVGTLPERITYRELQRRRITFDFQSSLLGGRAQLGGMVADFIVYLALGTIIIRVQSVYFHTSTADRQKDDDQRAVLESLRDPISGKYYVVYDLWDFIIYDAQALSDWLNRHLDPRTYTFCLGGPGKGVPWMPNQQEWDALMARVGGLEAENAGQKRELQALNAALFSGSLPPQIVIDTKNLRAYSVIANKIYVTQLSAITADMGVLTLGELRMYTGTWDSNATGFRLNATEIASQAAGVEKFLLNAATGLITVYGGNAIDGSCINAGTLTPASTNFDFHIMDGTFTNNSPSAGYVAWTGVTITYKGTTYTITAGNTNLRYIYWDFSVSTTAFQTGDTIPVALTNDDYLACVNVSGTAFRGDAFSAIEAERIIAGALIAQTIKAGAGTKDADLTGIQMDVDEIVGQLAGVDQFYLRAADGKAYFGAGAIIADAAGLKWYQGATQRGQILADGSGWLGASDKFSWTAAGVVSLDGATITQLSARVWHNAAQTTTSGVLKILDFNSEIFDRGGLHDTVTNNSRLTAPVAGRYLIIAHVQWNNESEVGMRQLGIKLNGAADGLAYDRRNATDVGYPNQGLSTMYDLAINDYVELEAKQDSGGNVNINSYTPHTPAFMMMRIGGS